MGSSLLFPWRTVEEENFTLQQGLALAQKNKNKNKETKLLPAWKGNERLLIWKRFLYLSKEL